MNEKRRIGIMEYKVLDTAANVRPRVLLVCLWGLALSRAKKQQSSGSFLKADMRLPRRQGLNRKCGPGFGDKKIGSSRNRVHGRLLESVDGKARSDTGAAAQLQS